jgi:hypothetical protein
MIINIIHKILFFKWIILLYISFLLSTIFVLTKIWFNDKFGDVSLESIIFTIQTTSITFPIYLYYSYSKRLILSFLIAFLLTFVFKFICKKIKQSILRKMCYIIFPLLSVFSSIFFLLTFHFDQIKRIIFEEYSTFLKNITI